MNVVYTTLWLLAISYGFALLLNYQTTAGLSGETPAVWPASSSIIRDKSKNTTLLFLHPKCPCSFASLNQYDAATADKAKSRAYVIFIKPDGADKDWCQSALVSKAREIPGLAVLIDEGSIETALFNARTSGAVLNYDKNGKLNFVGGITPGRGHEGDSAGGDSLKDLLSKADSGSPEIFKSDVYGCPLESPR